MADCSLGHDSAKVDPPSDPSAPRCRGVRQSLDVGPFTMIAHVSPFLIFGFLGCLVLGNLAGLIAVIGSFISHRRRIGLLWTAWLSVALGASASAMYFDDGGGWDWMLAFCVAPAILGTVSLIRIRSVRA